MSEEETPQISVTSDVRTWRFKKGNYHPLEIKAERQSGLVWLPSGNIRGVEDVRVYRAIFDEIEEYLSGDLKLLNDTPQKPPEPPRAQGGIIPPGTLAFIGEGPTRPLMPVPGPVAGLPFDPSAKITPPEAPKPPQDLTRPPSLFRRVWDSLKFFFVSGEDYSARYWVL